MLLWSKAGVGVAGYVQPILILSAGHPHTVFAGRGRGVRPAAKTAMLTQQGLSLAMVDNEPGRQRVADVENENWLNGVGHPAGGQRAQTVEAVVRNGRAHEHPLCAINGPSLHQPRPGP
jgi:hypothetical protein